MKEVLEGAKEFLGSVFWYVIFFLTALAFVVLYEWLFVGV